MPDNIFVKIYRNEREIRNFERDSKILEKRVLPCLSKILKSNDPKTITRNLMQVSRAMQHMSWSDGSIKKTFSNIPWNLLEQLHIFDRETIVHYVDALGKDDGFIKLIDTIKKCLGYAQKQVHELSERTALFRAKVAHYPMVERLTDALQLEAARCQEQISILEQEKKYSRSDLQFISEKVESIKQLNQDATKENVCEHLEDIKKQLLELAKSSADSSTTEVIQDPALIASIKDIENLIRRVKAKPKRTFQEHLETINLSSALSAIESRLSGQRKNHYEIEKITEYKVIVEKLQSNFSELKKFIYFGQGVEHIDNLIIRILDLIGQDISVLKNQRPKFINDIIRCLMRALAPENSKLFGNYLSEGNSLSDMLSRVIEYGRVNDEEKHEKSVEEDDGLDRFAMVYPEVFIACRIFNGELRKAHEMPFNTIKNQLKLLKQKADEKKSKDDGKKSPKEKVKGKDQDHDHILINKKDIIEFSNNIKDAKRKLTLFTAYLQDSSNLPEEDQKALLDKISHYFHILDQITETDSPIHAALFNDLYKQIEKIGSIESYIENIEKSTEDLSLEILDQYKEKLFKFFMQITDSKVDQFNLRKYRTSLCILQNMYEHYTKYNPARIQDKDFEEKHALCAALYGRLMVIASDMVKFHRFDTFITGLMPVILEGKITSLTCQGDDILLQGVPATIKDIIKHVSEPKSWNYSTLEELNKNKQHAKLKNDARRFVQFEMEILGQLDWTCVERKKVIAENVQEHAAITSESKKIRISSKKVLKQLSVGNLFDEKTIYSDIEAAHAFLLILSENLKMIVPQSPDDILKISYYQKLVEYAHYLTEKIITNHEGLDGEAKCVYRLAMLRCISVLGETFNSLRPYLDKDSGIAYDYKHIISFRNKLQHFSTTKTGPDELLYFIQHGKQPEAKEKEAEVKPKKTDQDPYKVYSPLKSMERILMQVSHRANVLDAFDEAIIDEGLLTLACEYMTTFIGGDLISRLECNQIFLDNFSDIYIDHAIDPLTDVDLGSVMVVLEQVRMYRNNLSHAHLAVTRQHASPGQCSSDSSSSDEESSADLERKLAAITKKKQHVTVKTLSPDALLNDRFKPAMQLCWSILMLTDKNRHLRPDLEGYICANIERFERFLEIMPQSDDMESRKADVIAKLTLLVKQFGRSHLSKKIARSHPEFDREKEKEHAQEANDGLGIFRQYYKKVYKIQSRRCNIEPIETSTVRSRGIKI